MRVALTIEYDGTNYCGWQVQPNGVTVQQVIEDCYFSATGERIKLVASGRTDSGVHAKGQVAHFDTALCQPAHSFMHVLNAILPNDIKIVNAKQVADDFNARYSAKRKTYTYSCYCSGVESPLLARYAVRLNEGLDMVAVQNATSCFVGEHDFSAFCATNTAVKTTVRTIFDFSVQQMGNRLVFSICGNGFLYNMVRIVVGAVLAVGYGKATIGDVETALKTGKRHCLFKTMPPNGLCLDSVEYGC